jgi:hypothetical protein
MPKKVPAWLKDLWREELCQNPDRERWESNIIYVQADLKECSQRDSEKIIPHSEAENAFSRQFKLYLKCKAPMPVMGEPEIKAEPEKVKNPLELEPLEFKKKPTGQVTLFG